MSIKKGGIQQTEEQEQKATSSNREEGNEQNNNSVSFLKISLDETSKQSSNIAECFASLQGADRSFLEAVMSAAHLRLAV